MNYDKWMFRRSFYSIRLKNATYHTTFWTYQCRILDDTFFLLCLVSLMNIFSDPNNELCFLKIFFKEEWTHPSEGQPLLIISFNWKDESKKNILMIVEDQVCCVRETLDCVNRLSSRKHSGDEWIKCFKKELKVIRRILSSQHSLFFELKKKTFCIGSLLVSPVNIKSKFCVLSFYGKCQQ